MASLNFGTLHATITANSTQYTKTINEMQQTTAAAMAAIAKSIEAATNQIGKSVPTPNLSSTINQMGQVKQAATAAAKTIKDVTKAAEAAGAARDTAAAKSSLASVNNFFKRIKADEAAAAAESAAADKSSIKRLNAYVKRLDAAEVAKGDAAAKAHAQSSLASVNAFFNSRKVSEAAATAEAAQIVTAGKKLYNATKTDVANRIKAQDAAAVKLLASITDNAKNQEAAKAAGVKLAFKNQATADAASVQADLKKVKDREDAAAKSATAAAKRMVSEAAEAARITRTTAVREARTTSTGRPVEEEATPKRPFGEIVQGMAQEMQSVANAFYTYLSKPLIDFGKYSVDVANQFEIAMSRITGLVGIASSQVNIWSQELRNIGPALGKGPEELARGLYFVTSSGQRGAQAMDVLVTSAKASSAGLGEVKTVADAVTSAINAYGEENLSSARAADIITAAVREGKFEAGGLATVIGRVLPLAKAMGVDFAEAAGAMAAMTRVGATIQQAGVSMTAVLGSMLKPTKEAKDELARYNLTFHQLREMMKQPGGFVNFMRLLDETFKGNEESMGKVFSDMRELRAVMNLLAQDSKKVDGVMKGVRDSVGDNERAFKAWADTNASKFVVVQQQMLVGFTDIGLAIGATLVPALAVLSTALNTGIEGFKTFDDSTKATVITIVALVAAIGPLLLGIAAIVKVVAFVTTTLYLAVAALAVLKFAIIAVPILVFLSVIALLAMELTGATRAQDEFNKAVVRSGEIQNSVIGIRDKRVDKEITAAVAISDPKDRVKALEKQLKQAQIELSGANRGITKAKSEVAKAGGIGNTLASYVPGIGAGFDMEIKGAAKNLENAQANAGSFTKQVERLTGELEKAKLAAKDVKGDWEDPIIGRSIKDTTDKLKLQTATFKKSHVEIEIYKLKLLGAKDSQLNGVKAWGAYFDAMEKQKKAFEKAKEIIKDIATPQEKFQAQVVELDEMLAHGTITVEQYARAFAKAKNEMSGATKEAQKFDAAASNSNEALDRISKWRDKMDIAVPDIAAAKKRKEELADTVAKKPVDIPIPKAVTDIVTKVKAAASSFWEILKKPRPVTDENDPGQDDMHTRETKEIIARKAMQEEDAKAFEKERNESRKPLAVDKEDKSFLGRLGNIFKVINPLRMMTGTRGPKKTIQEHEAEVAAQTSEVAAAKVKSESAETARKASADKEAVEEKIRKAAIPYDKEIHEKEVETDNAARKAAADASFEKATKEFEARKKHREEEENSAKRPHVPKDKDVASLTDDKGSILEILKSIAATNAAMAKKNNMEIEPANLVA